MAGDSVDAELRIFKGDGQRFNPAELLLRPGMDAVVSGEFLSRRLFTWPPGRTPPIKLSSPEWF